MSADLLVVRKLYVELSEDGLPSPPVLGAGWEARPTTSAKLDHGITRPISRFSLPPAHPRGHDVGHVRRRIDPDPARPAAAVGPRPPCLPGPP